MNTQLIGISNCAGVSKSTDRFAASPLIVDLDGTLTPTDTLIESIIHLIKKYPLKLFNRA